ncbi:SWC5 [Candida jiufengensis]|uniref:SWC5 n=1 Tax=Candida jiufengensis TaxID=497108 RepID=UPI002225848B|nr:SWC5 [Candida jiufengensis]KAI5950256.1 SWC5 [Candida jiufengensis]
MAKNQQIKQDNVLEPTQVKPASTIDDIEEDEDEEEDEDYDPTKKNEDEEDLISEDEEEEQQAPKVDYSKIESNISQVKTRSQKLHEKEVKKSKFIGKFEVGSNGLVKNTSSIDIDSIFDDLKENKIRKDEEEQIDAQMLEELNSNKLSNNKSIPQPETKQSEELISSTGIKQIKIQINYTFAGKLITESKLVDENSEEAKAYLNSTNDITSSTNQSKYRSEVPITRKDPITQKNINLRIKLKRPSLINKFLNINSKKGLKLSTLEKSRLDWASFLDKRKIGDDLKKYNLGSGYLDKQDFLNRMESKKDEIYQKAKDDDKRRQFQLQGK